MSDEYTRRFVFKLLAAIAAVPSATTPNRKRYGRITVAGHRAHLNATGESLRVYLDGVDVTRNCYEADDVAGYVLVYVSVARVSIAWCDFSSQTAALLTGLMSSGGPQENASE